MLRTHLAFIIVLSLSASISWGQEYSIEKIEGAPEADGLSDEIAELIADEGVRVKKGSSRTFCELWFCKELAIDPLFKPTGERLYPFTPGQLIGLLHFQRRGYEFRDQQISSGWYTLRFGLQPVDGNHEGTSPTRDFLLLVDVEEDELPENWSEDDLNEMSGEAAGSGHPALICLQLASEGSEQRLQHDESNDWWILHLELNANAGGKAKRIPVDLVVVGHADE